MTNYRYLVLYNVDGIHHSDRVKATSPEDVEYKLRGRYPGYLKFKIESIQLQTSKKRPPRILNQQGMRVVPTFKQFTCSFSIMNNGMYEAHQVALHALDEASAKETLQHAYPDIIARTIRIVEAS
jgi:hypothetical protein